MLLGYKLVQHISVLNTLGNCNTVVIITILYYNLMGHHRIAQSVVDQNVVLWPIPVII